MMSLSQFLTPPEEHIEDEDTYEPDMDEIIARYTGQDVEEEPKIEDELVEPLPVPSSTEALNALELVFIFKNFQESSTPNEIRSLRTL
jgi:hypothetical protein